MQGTLNSNQKGREAFRRVFATSLRPPKEFSGPERNDFLFEHLLAASDEFRKSRPQNPLREIALEDHIFDLELLSLSSLYERSRRLYLKLEGVFTPAVISAARAFDEYHILQPNILYTPNRTEVLWFSKRAKGLKLRLFLRNMSRLNAFLFHDQNHSIFRRHLPPPPKNAKGLKQYLNFSESLAVMFDNALADQLGPVLAPYFFGSKVIYSGYVPSKTKAPKLGSESYRNALLLQGFATYCLLEGYTEDVVDGFRRALEAQWPCGGRRWDYIQKRFIEGENRAWQNRYMNKILAGLKESKKTALNVPPHPLFFKAFVKAATPVLKLYGL